jgi:DNA-binding transcriptional regulator YiaG
MTPSQIRRIRKSLGMSVREFAAALGYSPRNGHVSVYRLENGDRRPSEQAIMLMKQLAARVPKVPRPAA